MKRGRLILRNLAFFRATNLGVALGVAVGAAVLTGALVVGDSVRRTLREQALLRIGQVDLAMTTGDRMSHDFLARELREELPEAEIASAVQLRAIASADGGARRALDVQVLTVKDKRLFALAPTPPTEGQFWPNYGEVFLNERLARQLETDVGGRVVLRIDHPGVMPREAMLGGGGESIGVLSLEVTRVVTDDQFGRFDLTVAPQAPFTAFVDYDVLQQTLGLHAQAANVFLIGAGGDVDVDEAHAALRDRWQLRDAGLVGRHLEFSPVDQLESLRILFEPQVEEALARVDTPALGVSTYLANELRVGDRAVPYSLVSALGPVTAGGTGDIEWDALPADVGDDGIAINSWMAEGLQAGVGDELTLSWWRAGPDEELVEETRAFTIRAVVPVAGLAADRTLMPGLPGIADAESCREWDIGLPIDYDQIGDRDEEWWDEHEGTPKAFVTLAAGREMWGSERFGYLTAVRHPASPGGPGLRDALRAELDPVDLGLAFRDMRGPALAASTPATDFGGLFLGLSFFLLGAAFLLVGLLLALGVLQRSAEVGTLLALGFRPRTVLRMLLGEAALLSAAGSIVGALLAAVYAQLVIGALGTIWEGAVAGAAITFHASPGVLVLGATSSFVVAVGAAWLALRRQAKRPSVELLTQRAGVAARTGGRRVSGLVAGVGGIGALAAMAWGFTASGPQRPGAAFAAGALALVALLALCRFTLRARGDAGKPAFRTLAGLAWSNATRRPARSMATIVLLASGSFLVVVVGAFRKTAPDDPTARDAGTGGFALVGRSSLAIVPDRKVEAAGFRLGREAPDGVSVVPLRVRAGDDASCLNLNRPQEPRLVGVAPREFAERGAFTFAATRDDRGENPWLLLARDEGDGVVPAIGDAASVTWSMHKGLGESIPYVDEAGREFEVRIVATLAGSILQGDLLIDERHFRDRFPTETGYRMFLVDAPPAAAPALAEDWMRELRDVGLELEPAVDRLAAFDAVQNTYLVVFQVLGALGLLLGSVGMGVVVLRNVAERRSELAVLTAVGFPAARVRRLLLVEHALLLTAGTGSGAVGAIAAVLPLLPHQGGAAPVLPVLGLLAGMLVAGLLWVGLATVLARRGAVLETLGRAG